MVIIVASPATIITEVNSRQEAELNFLDPSLMWLLGSEELATLAGLLASVCFAVQLTTISLYRHSQQLQVSASGMDEFLKEIGERILLTGHYHEARWR